MRIQHNKAQAQATATATRSTTTTVVTAASAIHHSAQQPKNNLNDLATKKSSKVPVNSKIMPFLNLSMLTVSKGGSRSSLILQNNAKCNTELEDEKEYPCRETYPHPSALLDSCSSSNSCDFKSRNINYFTPGNCRRPSLTSRDCSNPQARKTLVNGDDEDNIEESVSVKQPHHSHDILESKNSNSFNKSRSRRRSSVRDDPDPLSPPRKNLLLLTLTAKDTDLVTLMKWTVLALVFITITPMISGDDKVGIVSSAGNNWERPSQMPKISSLEVMCGSQHMEVHLSFDKPFQGLVTSKGMYGQRDCMYVPSRTGKNEMVFNIYYDKCGTKPDNNGKFYENTVVIQYDEELIEAWDEAKRLRCEWFSDYEKTATKTTPMVISDLEVVELNFHGDNVDCWMEIQEGKGPWSSPLNGIAPLGSTLTMVIAVKDPSGEFDMRVKNCEASGGQTGKSLALSDPEGCILRPKLLGKFSKIKLDDGRATVLTYAFISSFKFPDQLNVNLRCTVEICRHGCPDHCSASNGPAKGTLLGQYSDHEPVAAQSQNTVNRVERPNKLPEPEESKPATPSPVIPVIQPAKPEIHNIPINTHPQVYDAQKTAFESQRFPQHRPILLNPGQNFPQINTQMRPPGPPLPPQFNRNPQRPPSPPGRPPPLQNHKLIPPGLMRQRPDRYPPPHPGPLPPRFTGTIKHTIGPDTGPPQNGFMENQQRHHAHMIQNMLLKPEPKNGNMEELSQRSGEPPKEQEGNGKREISNKNKDDSSSDSSAGDSKDSAEKSSAEKVETEMLMEAQPLRDDSKKEVLQDNLQPKQGPILSTSFPKGPRKLRIRRSVTGTSDIIGVQGAFKVVSQADLNFALNVNASNTRPTVVLRGKMSSGDPIYGICLPRVGFGVVFFGVGLATLVAILIAAFLAYVHYSMHQYKGQLQQQINSSKLNDEGLQMPSPYPVFPMVMLKKMW